MTVRELKELLDAVDEEHLDLPVILQQRGRILQEAVKAGVGKDFITNDVYSGKEPDDVFRISSDI